MHATVFLFLHGKGRSDRTCRWIAGPRLHGWLQNFEAECLECWHWHLQRWERPKVWPGCGDGTRVVQCITLTFSLEMRKFSYLSWSSSSRTQAMAFEENPSLLKGCFQNLFWCVCVSACVLVCVVYLFKVVTLFFTFLKITILWYILIDPGISLIPSTLTFFSDLLLW